MIDGRGNMFWRGLWEYCTEYDTGDVVWRAGGFYLCLQQSAGVDPLDPYSANHWEPFDSNRCVGGMLWANKPTPVTMEHVGTRAELPSNLVLGRLYWVADEGKVILDIGNGPEEYGGSGPRLNYYRGPFETELALVYAHPTDIVGAFAVVLSTGTFWIWKNGQWVDTGVLATELGIGEAPADGKIYGRRDKTWAEVISGGGGTGDHDELENVRVEGDDPLEAWHLTESTAKWAENAANRRPQKPQNLSPFDGEFDVYQFARFVGSNYFQPEGVPMAAMQLEIVEVFDETFSQSATWHEMVGDELKPDETEYSWRLRYQTVEGQWSEWSDLTSFRTQNAFSPSVIRTPVLLSPTENAAVPAQNAVLLSSGFVQVGEATTHKASSWRVNTQRNGQGVDLWEKIDSATDLTSAIVQDNLYTVGADKTLYAGVKHKAANGQESRWSPFVGFRLRPYHTDHLIGVEFRIVGGATVCRHIDQNGVYVTPRPSYFDSHPLYAALAQNHAIGIRQMSLILPIFVRCVSDPANKVYRIWLSPNEFEGSHLHPAFRVDPGGFYIARYLSSNSGNDGLTSAPGSRPAPWSNVNDLLTNISTYLPAVFSSVNLYQDSVIRLLMLVEGLSFDPSRPFGYPNSLASSGGDQATTSRWRGIFQLWTNENANHYLLGVSYIAGQPIKLGDPASPQALIDVGIGNANVSGMYIQDILSGPCAELGIDYDYLFLPKEANAVAPGPFNAKMPIATGGVAQCTGIGSNTILRVGIGVASSYARFVKKIV